MPTKPKKMNIRRDPHETPLAGLGEQVAAITSDEVRDLIESVPEEPVQHYLVYRSQEDVTEKTIIQDCQRIVEYLQFISDRCDSIDSVTRDDIWSFIRWRASFGVSFGVARKYRETLCDLHAHLWSVFDIDPVAITAISSINLKEMLDSMVYADIHAAEIRRLCRHAASQRDGLMIRTAHAASLSSECIRSLDTDQLGQHRDVLHIEQEEGGRRVPLSEELAEALREWIRTEHPTPSQSSAALFPSRRGGHLTTRESFREIVNKASKRAELYAPRPAPDQMTHPRFTPRALRISGRDRWREQGVPEHVCEYVKNGSVEAEGTSVDERKAFQLFRDRISPLL